MVLFNSYLESSDPKPFLLWNRQNKNKYQSFVSLSFEHPPFICCHQRNPPPPSNSIPFWNSPLLNPLQQHWTTTSTFAVEGEMVGIASSLSSNLERHFVFDKCQGKQKAQHRDNNGCHWHRGWHQTLFCVFCGMPPLLRFASAAFFSTVRHQHENASSVVFFLVFFSFFPSPIIYTI